MTPPVTTPTAEELALARKCAFDTWLARYRSGSHLYEPDPHHEDAVLMLYLRGTCDSEDAVQAALAAIRETTERAAKLIAKERLYREQGEATAKASKQRQEERDCQTMKIAFAQAEQALRTNAHLRGEAHDA